VTKPVWSDQPINIGKFLVQHGARSKKSVAPTVWTDPYSNGKLTYVSPLTGNTEVTSREQRKEEMKKFDVREVDPSERTTWKRKDEKFGSKKRPSASDWLSREGED
jgi:hypothetical protein